MEKGRKRLRMKKPQMSETTRKKMDNFWYYYKFHVLIGAAVLFMLVIFIKDIVTKVDYDYDIAFVTEYIMAEEDTAAIQAYFEANGEDLNGDGEVHVEIQNYVIPSEENDSYDAQMLMANQTKLTVDLQEGISMIWFMSEKNIERYKDTGVLPASREEFIPVKECAGFQETGEPQSIEDLYVELRIIDGTSLEEKEEKVSYFEDCRKLFEKFVS